MAKVKQEVDAGKAGVGAMEARKAATEALDAAIAAFREAAKDVPEANKELLEKHFSKKQMSALWKRLEKGRNLGGATVQQCWGELMNMPKPVANAAKASTLFAFVMTDDSKVWHSKLLEITESVTTTRTKGMSAEPLYYGQLVQRLGQQDADEHIAMKKYKTKKDWQGTIQYLFIGEKEKLSVTRAKSASTKRL